MLFRVCTVASASRFHNRIMLNQNYINLWIRVSRAHSVGCNTLDVCLHLGFEKVQPRVLISKAL